jgi:DNA/RNA-binding domain of Phe-tRNA-synthetase-like protein
MPAITADLTPAFRAAFPDGVFGLLAVSRCPNRARVTALDGELRAIEASLRARYPGDAIDVDPVARAYAAHFRRYGGRYPVVHQVRSILSGRPIESPSALVTAMFAAEVDSLVLTSGHDPAALRGSLRVDVSADGDAYTKLSGKRQRLRAGDMVVRDDEGIIASVVHGPDDRTRLRGDSAAAVYGAWCPAGVGAAAARAHLAALARLIRLEWPGAEVEAPRILSR